jgi:repressor LexA
MKHRDSEARDKIIPFVNDFYRDNHRSPSLRQISAFTGIPRMTVQRMLNTFADEGIIDYDGETIVTEVTNKVENETTPVGVLGNIPCGNLSLEEAAIEEIVLLPVSLIGQGEFFILHARGDSMTGAGINDGDMVLIKKTEEAYPGQIVVAYVEGEGNTLKTYKEKNGKAYLHPENKKYADIPLHDCKIQGIAVSVTRKLDTKGRTGK